MKLIKNILPVIGIFSIIFILSTGMVSAEEKVFKVGILGPFTGASAKSGTEIKDASTMAFEEADYKIGPYKIELIYIDSQSDPAKATNAYAEAGERKGVQAGLLGWHTDVSTALQQVYAKYKIPHFFNFGAGKTVNDTYNSLPEDQRYLFGKGWPIPQKLVAGYVDLLNSSIAKGTWKPEKKIAGLWGEDTDWGRSLIGGLAQLLKANGWEIFTEEYVDKKKTDFYPFLNKCKDNGVTLLAGSSSAIASVSAMIKQKDEIRFKGLVIADGLGWVGGWYKMTGPASDGVLDMVPQFSTDKQKEWAERFKKKYGYEPGPTTAGMSYDYAQFFIRIANRAIQKFGSLTSETMYKVGRDEVVKGTLTYGRDDGAIMHARYGTDMENTPDPKLGPNDWFIPILQYKGGDGYVVYPEDVKKMDLVVK